MSQEKPKVYTAEFREPAVKLANESDKPIAQTAKDLGINENTLHSWISKRIKRRLIKRFIFSIGRRSLLSGIFNDARRCKL